MVSALEERVPANSASGIQSECCESGSGTSLEAFRTAYWLRFLPLAIYFALQAKKDSTLAVVRRNLRIPGCDTDPESGKPIDEMSPWELMNVDQRTAMSLPQRLASMLKLDLTQVLDIVNQYHVTTLNRTYLVRTYYAYFNERFPDELLLSPSFLVPASALDSIPQASELLSLGSAAAISVPVSGNHSSLDFQALDGLLTSHLLERRAVISIFSVSEQDAAQVMTLRDSYRSQGLEFSVHVNPSARPESQMDLILQHRLPGLHAALTEDRVLEPQLLGAELFLEDEKLKSGLGKRSSTRSNSGSSCLPKVSTMKRLSGDYSVSV